MDVTIRGRISLAVDWRKRLTPALGRPTTQKARAILGPGLASARLFAKEASEMEVPGPERRLAAVLAADMVGYSRLMEVDETGTLARLKTHRIELIDPAIAKNRGCIIKTSGDGMLVEFHSYKREADRKRHEAGLL